MMVNFFDIEAQLISELRGRRLVCEIGLDLDRSETAAEGMRALRDAGLTESVYKLAHRFPALTVTYLVCEGVYRYSQGDYWPNLSLSGLEPTVMGPAFEKSVRVLDLEPFENLAEGGQRYVTPILAHGGIPEYCLGDFFRILLHELRRGASDSREILARWRSRGAAFTGVDRPVLRFLLNGGDTSIDLLERCIDMVRFAADRDDTETLTRFGLPDYILRAFLAFDPDERRRATAQLAERVPPPVVFVDPWSTTGPALHLPAARSNLRDGRWRLRFSGESSYIDASREDRTVPLNPAAEWLVEFDRGLSKREYTFLGLASTKALLFAFDSFRLLQPGDRLAGSMVWLVSPCGKRGEVRVTREGEPLKPREQAPPLTGPWSGYQLAAYDIGHHDSVFLGPLDQLQQLPVRRSMSPVSMLGQPVPGVQVEGSGLPVYSAAPGIELTAIAEHEAERWHAVVRYGEELDELTGPQLLEAGATFLDRYTRFDGPLTQLEVVIRGSLGADFRAEFAVVPGLTIDRPAALSVPGGPPAVVTVVTSGGTHRVEVPPGLDAALCALDGDLDGSSTLRVTVPCLQWSLVLDGSTTRPFLQEVIRLGASALVIGKQALLMLRTHLSGQRLRLELRDGSTSLQALEGETTGQEGRWTFDLQRLASTIQASSAPALSICLIVASYDIKVAEVASVACYSDIAVSQFVTGAFVRLEITFREDRLLRGRQVRIWPLTRPWATVRVWQIPDDARGQVIIETTGGELPPGAYLVHILVDDGMARLRRPQLRSQGTTEFRLGLQEQEEEWRKHLPPADPYRALGKAFNQGELSHWATASTVRQLGESPFQALLTLAEYSKLWDASGSRSKAIADLLYLNLPAAIEAGLRAVGDHILSPGQLLQCAVALIAFAPDLPASPPPFEVESELWELCPGWATTIALCNPARDRGEVLEEKLGMPLAELHSCPLFPHTKELIPFLELPPAALEAIRSEAHLVPKCVLDLDYQSSAQFEWLLATRRGDFDAKGWIEEYDNLTDSPPFATASIEKQFCALHPNSGTRRAHPTAQLPSIAFAASLHLVQCSSWSLLAMGALQALAPNCPAIVNRSICLASLLCHPSYRFSHQVTKWTP